MKEYDILPAFKSKIFVNVYKVPDTMFDLLFNPKSELIATFQCCDRCYTEYLEARIDAPQLQKHKKCSNHS